MQCGVLRAVRSSIANSVKQALYEVLRHRPCPRGLALFNSEKRRNQLLSPQLPAAPFSVLGADWSKAT